MGILSADELSPLVAELETERSAKEEAISAKMATERKSREFISGQRELIEKVNKEKVCLTSWQCQCAS